MGIRGLLTKCVKNQDKCADFVDLVQVAQEKDGIEILVDTYCLQKFILDNFFQSQISLYNNPFLKILGGEYNALDKYLTKFIEDLQSLKINLVFFTDGCRGSSKTVFKQKEKVWLSRRESDLQTVCAILNVCRGYQNIEELDPEVKPYLCQVCRSTQLIETFVRCGCEVVSLSSGEADYVLARNLLHRPKAFAILTNDSDFCVFKGCRFIPQELFDVSNQLGFGKRQPLLNKPAALLCGVVSSSRVSSMLQLQHESQMIEVSILSGNDYTSPYLDHLKRTSGSRIKYLDDVCQVVRLHGRVETIPEFKEELARNRNLAAAVKKSREFYDLSVPFECDLKPEESSMLRALMDGVEKEMLAPGVIGMYNGIYWPSVVVQEMGYDLPDVQHALTELRMQMYRMILENPRDRVMEYKIRRDGTFGYEYVPSARARLPTIKYIEKGAFQQNLNTFQKIFTHFEPDCQPRWHKRYGSRVGFCCYVLRYFLVLNTQANLYIGYEEFLCIVAMVFCQVDEAWYMSQAICPSTRCLTLISWLQVLYNFAYKYIGKMLFLTEEFPEPRSFLCGSAWTAFYMATQHRGDADQILGSRNVQRILQDIHSIISEKKHLLKHLMDGIFHFDDRKFDRKLPGQWPF